MIRFPPLEGLSFLVDAFGATGVAKNGSSSSGGSSSRFGLPNQNPLARRPLAVPSADPAWGAHEKHFLPFERFWNVHLALRATRPVNMTTIGRVDAATTVA